jgi:hypothetical protein
MATVKNMYWKNIPYGVRAVDEKGDRVTRQLARDFEAAIDAAAMADGVTEDTEYRGGFHWGEPEERLGSAMQVVQAVLEEIVTAYTPSRLAKLARRENA